MFTTQQNRDWFKETMDFAYPNLIKQIELLLSEFESYLLDNTDNIWHSYEYCRNLLAENFLLSVLEFSCASQKDHKELGIYVTNEEFEVIKNRICSNTGEDNLAGKYDSVLDPNWFGFNPWSNLHLLAKTDELEDIERDCLIRFQQRMSIVCKDFESKTDEEKIMPKLPSEAKEITFEDIYENDENGNPTGSDFVYCNPDTDTAWNSFEMIRNTKVNLCFASICRKKVEYQDDDNNKQEYLGLFYECVMMYQWFNQITGWIEGQMQRISMKEKIDLVCKFLETNKKDLLTEKKFNEVKFLYTILKRLEQWHLKPLLIDGSFNKVMYNILRPLLERNNFNDTARDAWGDYEYDFNAFCEMLRHQFEF